MKTMNTMNDTEKKAEALFQLAVAQRSGVRSVVWANDNEEMITFFNNGTLTINDFNKLSVQFELNSNVWVVRI